MSLLDFAAREVALTVGGRRFVCRPPTVHTVALFLRLFGLQAAALCSAVESGFTVSRKEIIEHLVSPESRASAVLVLETCVSAGDAGIASVDLQVLRALADTVAGLTDTGKIIEATGLAKALDSQPAASADGDESADHDADAICYVAAHFGQAPTAVLEWPYLAFLAAGEHMSRANERIKELSREQGSGKRYTPIPDVPLEGIIFEKGA